MGISLKNVYYTYQEGSPFEGQALSDISLEIKDGSYTAIIGHTGSGKSTLLQLLNGLLRPTKGTIQFEDFVLDNHSEPKEMKYLRKKVGLVFQFPESQLFAETVLADVAFGLENQGIPRGEMLQRVEKAIDQVGMLKFKDREPSRLSGGQKQRVAIAGIIALRPTIIILDEATSMLDPEGREDLMAVMRELQKKFQLTIISITHDLSEIALSDRTLVFQKGKIESSMTPRELFSRNDLNEIGLDKPFSKQVQESLSSHFPLKQDYLTESELLDQLWESL